MSSWFEEFKIIVTNNIGRVNPRSVTEQYFSKIGKSDLWQTFIDNTSHLDKYTFTKRVKFLDAGMYDSLDKCYCGNDVSILDREVSKYCSMKCMLSAPERGKQISETKLSKDHTESNAKREYSMFAKYGVKFNSQREDMKDVWTKTRLKQEIFDKLSDYAWMKEQYVTKERTGVDIGVEIGCYYGTVLEYCKKHGFEIRQRTNYSLVEVQFGDWLESIDIDYQSCNTSVLHPQEIDIYLEKYNLGIELNGVYYHSKKPRFYHQVKTDMAEKAGIQLLHFTDDEWYNKQNVVKSIVMNKLGLNAKIGARECELREISNKESKPFLEQHHIQGYSAAKVAYGLFYDDELVMAASFGSPRFNKKYGWEVIRVCSKGNVIGGLSRLMSKFRKEHDGSIISYVDRKYGNGKSFVNIGFTVSHITDPGYTWNDGHVTISRFKSQKKNLSSWLPSFDLVKSETENMIEAGYNRLWDSGQIALVMM